MSPQETVTTIGLIIGLIGAIAGYIFRARMAKIEAVRENERNEHKQDRLEWQLTFDKLKIEFEEVKQQGEEVKQQGENTKSLIEVVSQLADGMGRADRTTREGYQQITSAINITREAQHEASDKLDAIDSHLKASATATKEQVDRVVAIIQTEMNGLAIRLDSLPTLFTDHQMQEREQLQSVIGELMQLLDKATGIVESCKTSNNEHPKKGVPNVSEIEKEIKNG